MDSRSLDVLENVRLLRKELKHGSFYYEIGHDRLAAAIYEKRVPRGLGKLELQLDEVAKQQGTLRKEIDALRFLLLGFVTDWELVHLRRLNQEGECHYRRGADKGDRFTAEIIRLRDLGLVSKKVSHSLGTWILKAT